MKTVLCAAVATSLMAMSGFASPTLAQSATDQMAKKHFESGQLYFDSGDYNDALREFNRALSLSKRAQLHYNISLCHERLGDLDNAAKHLELYLTEVKEVANRPALERRLSNFKERIEQKKKIDTPVTADPEPTEKPEPTSTDTEPADSFDDNTDTAAQDNTAAQDSGADETNGGGGGANIPMIASFAVGGLGLIGFATFGIMALSKKSEIEGSPCGMAGNCTPDQVSDMDTFALIADISLGVMLAGAVAGVLFMFLLKGDKKDSASSFQLAPALSDNFLGAAMSGRF